MLGLLASLYAGRPSEAPVFPEALWPRVSPTFDELRAMVDGAEQAAGRALLDRLPFGVIALDERCHLLLENESARESLNASELLTRLGERVRPWADSDVEAFVKTVQTACTDTATSARSFELTLARRKWSLPARLLGLRLGSPPAAALIVILPETGREAALRRLLMTMFALTRSETDVAICMMQGLSMGQVAKIRGVTAPTVRGHWQSVQYKVGNCGDDALVSLLYSALLIRPPMGRTSGLPIAR
jgi:DNA-binding CsgD family transcriptional regulator